MKKFELTETFVVGHAQIDKEPEELVAIINDMVDALADQDLLASKQKWLSFREALVQHFENEDAIMGEFKYEELNHNKFHDGVHAELEKAGKDCHSIEDWERCLQTVLSTLVDVILKHDLKFATHLRQIGYAAQ